jgi:hypothetical protein
MRRLPVTIVNQGCNITHRPGKKFFFLLSGYRRLVAGLDRSCGGQVQLFFFDQNFEIAEGTME